MTTGSSADIPLCDNPYQLEVVVFSVIGFFVLLLLSEMTYIIVVWNRRRKLASNESETKIEKGAAYYMDDFQFFLLAFVYQMKREGHLKGGRASQKDAADAYENELYFDNIDAIKEDVSKYFDLCNNFVEGPYFGFNAARKTTGAFVTEELKHRTNAEKGAKMDKIDESCVGSGIYEPLGKRDMSKIGREKTVRSLVKSSASRGGKSPTSGKSASQKTMASRDVSRKSGKQR